MGKRLKVMHGLSEVAGQNSYSVTGLKEIGIDADSVVYYKHPFAYSYDKCLNIDKTKRILLPIYALKLGLFFIYALFRYNTFHFHFGHSILNCIELPIYRLFNKKFFFEFHGSDLRDHKRFCSISGMPFDKKEATSSRQHKRNAEICRLADGIIVHDDELLPYLPKLCAPIYVVPLRVDISRFCACYPTVSNETIRIVHAPSKRAIKGTEYILKAFETIKKQYNNVELILVEGKSQQEAFEIYKTADIIIDQLYVGTYGVFAIECMAMGKPVITYISDNMKELLPSDLPIISANTETITEKLEMLINDDDLRVKAGKQGRTYVENYHDYKAIAYILKDIYIGNAAPQSGRKAFEQVKRIKESMRR